jgi:peptidylprolyl isomerase
MTRAKQGSLVRVHYTGRLEDGTLFDSSLERGPLEFTVGDGKIIPGLEAAIVGMRSGEKKTAWVPPEQAYGPYQSGMVFVVARKQIPDDLTPEAGQKLEIQHSDGRTAQLLVTAVTDATVTLDANHPLAGKTLIFEIELLDVVT